MEGREDRGRVGRRRGECELVDCLVRGARGRGWHLGGADDVFGDGRLGVCWASDLYLSLGTG